MGRVAGTIDDKRFALSVTQMLKAGLIYYCRRCDQRFKRIPKERCCEDMLICETATGHIAGRGVMIEDEGV